MKKYPPPGKQSAIDIDLDHFFRLSLSRVLAASSARFVAKQGVGFSRILNVLCSHALKVLRPCGILLLSPRLSLCIVLSCILISLSSIRF